ncbi:S-layer homology domain-containing protein [Paenibacillus sp. 1_12]|uniref:S-layer homology domain-containing protein n=1 Tax=Paenibacillus sp. 1_12 TaxID=1566278 RepID=UPI0008EA052F|nr:S-layer homology domain-containing protein [Paenibacillus sp. 1_12]SFL86958.1 S-layer homology domain-containing protein [Paenibacillus sp. 1_12]
MMGFKKTIVVTTMVASLFGGSLAYGAGFKDVGESNWAYNTLQWALGKGIAQGFEDGNFSPSDSVTEEQFLSLIIRAYGDTPEIPAPSTWSSKYYSLADNLNYPVSKVKAAPISRVKVAEIITGTQGKNYSGELAIQYLLGKGLAQGKTDLSIQGFQGADTLTRAESVQFIKNVLDKAPNDKLLVRPAQASNPAELPQIPIKDKVEIASDAIKAVGGYDEKLNKMAVDMKNATSSTGFKVMYNSGQKVLALYDKSDLNFMVFSDATTHGSDKYGTKVVFYNMIDQSDGHSVITAYAEASAKALATVGVNITANQIIDGVQGKLNKEQIVNVNGVDYGFMVIKFGTSTLYTLE